MEPDGILQDVQHHIQSLVDGQIEASEFVDRLVILLKVNPNPNLHNFLKVIACSRNIFTCKPISKLIQKQTLIVCLSLYKIQLNMPAFRQSLFVGEYILEGIRPPAQYIAFRTMNPAFTSIIA